MSSISKEVRLPELLMNWQCWKRAPPSMHRVSLPLGTYPWLVILPGDSAAGVILSITHSHLSSSRCISLYICIASWQEEEKGPTLSDGVAMAPATMETEPQHLANSRWERDRGYPRSGAPRVATPGCLWARFCMMESKQ